MNWQEIREEFESYSITLKALAEKYDIKLGTLYHSLILLMENYLKENSEKVTILKKIYL